MSHEWKTAMVEGPVTRAEKAEAELQILVEAIEAHRTESDDSLTKADFRLYRLTEEVKTR